MDALSEFGVKGSLKKAVWCEDINYSCADDITKYLVAKFVDDDTKYHVHLNLCKIRKKNNKNFLKINGCMQPHMICFSPNGNVTAKVSLCFCDACIEGKFLECLVEERLYLIENSDVVSDKDFIEGEDIENEQNELYEMKSDFVFDMIQKDGVIALYSLLTH